MRDGTIRQREFVHDRSVYRVRVNPYRTSEGSIEGVVAVILDMADFRKPVTAKQSRKRRSKG